MDRALIRNFQQLEALFFRQRSNEVNIPPDSIKCSLFRFALGAIGGVNLRVPQVDRNLLERPALSPRIHRNGH